jgi:hypothetical protein
MAQAPSMTAESVSEPRSELSYKTVAEALDAVKSIPGASVTTTKPDSWIIVSEPGGMGIWSFAPATRYAYPAVVRRVLKVREKGDVFVEMTALCQATQEACDKLMKEFEEMNARMRQQVQNRLKNGT